MVLEHRELLEGNGHLERVRSAQAVEWMNELLSLGLAELFRNDAEVAARLPLVKEGVRGGRMTPFAASRELLARFSGGAANPGCSRLSGG